MLLDNAVCFGDAPVCGSDVHGPSIAKWYPEVDLNVRDNRRSQRLRIGAVIVYQYCLLPTLLVGNGSLTGCNSSIDLTLRRSRYPTRVGT